VQTNDTAVGNNLAATLKWFAARSTNARLEAGFAVSTSFGVMTGRSQRAFHVVMNLTKARRAAAVV